MIKNLICTAISSLGFTIFWIFMFTIVSKKKLKSIITLLLGSILGVSFGIFSSNSSIVSELITVSSLIAGIGSVLLYMGITKTKNFT